jgi:hypothetical protein
MMEIGFLSGRKPLHHRAEGGSLKDGNGFSHWFMVNGSWLREVSKRAPKQISKLKPEISNQKRF